jgi:radical SAM superfamily enzyme YgiQ (UPF0313 family)
MGARVLLISHNRCTAPDPVFPLGLACLNSALRRAGHEVHWADLLADAEPLEEVLGRCRPEVAGISLRNLDDVLIGRQETFFDNLRSLVETIRRRSGCPVVLGGSGYSIFPRRLLEVSDADYGICGEGEVSFVSLISALERPDERSRIPGLAWREPGRIGSNPPARGGAGHGVEEADRPERITRYYLRASGMLNVQTQRGCPCHCCYCTYPVIEGSERRARPAEAVAEEFARLERLGARYLFLVDSVFNASARHVTEVCEAILRRELKLAWGCFLRPQGLTAGLMRLMKRAGLAHIEFGSDSFCDEVLAACHKGLTFEDIAHSDDLANLERIDCCHFLIAGGPGETPETLERGFEASARLKNAVILAVPGMRIYPGTPLCEQALAEGRIGSEAELLAPVYYVAPGLSVEALLAQLREFARRRPNWIVGEPAPGYLRVVERLRQKGALGPLWSYFAAAQRLWPGAGGNRG